MPDQWQVLKFGGTSVAGRQQWETISSLAAERSRLGHRVLLVCSAVAGVTNRLEALTKPGCDIQRAINELLNVHESLATSLGVDASALLEKARDRLASCLVSLNHEDAPEHTAALLAMGEWMISNIGKLYLSQSMNVSRVDAREALQIISEEEAGQRRSWLSARCEPGRDDELAARWADLAPVLITEGYIAATAGGKTALLGRGGSDTSAALLASRLGASEVEIWTDVPGLFSADPALEPGALLIRELDYTEALEMAASGARVVHPQCIRAAADVGLSIQVRDLARPHLQGTRISGLRAVFSESRSVQGIKAVTFQEPMLVMLLENLDTRQQVGFLARVFSIFSRRGVSVDLVATSETTTTVAVNAVDNHLDGSLVGALSRDLSEICRVRVYQDCCCVNLVGRGARTALSRLGPAAASFNEWPLLMLSQSANDMCLSFLVYPGHARSLLRDLHSSLIVEGEISGEPGLYGPSWRDMEAKA